VEIRSHGGTIDANKILLWVKLHQHILDKLEDLEISQFKTSSTSIEEQLRNFVDFLDDPMLRQYVLRLADYYSNIKI
jgi:hypothetical protein